MGILSAFTANALEFSLKSGKENTIEGPFEFKEGSNITLPDSLYIIRDIDKFGKNSFTLEVSGSGKKYGPFNLRNNTSFSIEKASYSIFIINDPEQQAKQNDPNSTENKSKGKLDSDLLIKFEKTLDTVERNFNTAVSAQRESQWFKEYSAKLSDLKNTARELQNEIIKAGLMKEYNIPKYVLTMDSALKDLREDSKNGNSGFYSNDSNGFSSKRGSSEDSLSKASRAGQGRSFRKSDSALKTSTQDFALAVTHLRESIKDLTATGYWNTQKKREPEINPTKR